MRQESTIGVGLIGANADRGWARAAHIPALRADPRYDLVAVGTSNATSAQRAAETFGAGYGYSDVRALMEHPDVDLVVISVKVPYHRELTLAAIEAGKMVFCEWPLGNGLAETTELARAAAAKNIRTMVGLQAREAPVFRYIRDLVMSGVIGEVLSTTLIGSGMAWGPAMPADAVFAADKANGVTMLMIPFGHAIDAVCSCLGEIGGFQSLLANRRTSTTILETGEHRALTAEDQLAVIGFLQSGAPIIAHYRGGVSRGTNFRWEINGTKGDLVVTGDSGLPEMTDLVLQRATGDMVKLEVNDIPADYACAPEAPVGVAFNVAQLYRRFASDIEKSEQTVPDFGDALARHRMLDEIERAARRSRSIWAPD